MSKILRNDDPVVPVELADTGVTVAPTSSYTIPPQDYPTFAASSDTIRALSLGTLILNDGGSDVTNLSSAVDIIKGWCPTTSDDSEDFFFDYGDIPIGEGPHTLFSYTVTDPDILSLSRIQVACRIESYWTVYLNGNVVGDLRTGAAQPRDSFIWNPSRSFAIGDLIEIVLMKRSGAPDVSVGLNIQGSISTP